MLAYLTARAQQEFTVNGHITGLEDGNVVLLMKNEGQVGYQVAADTVKNGHFTLKYNAGTETEKFSLLGHSKGFPSMSLNIWAKGGSMINITGNGKTLKTWDVESDIPEQAEWCGFIKANKELWEEYQRYSIIRSDTYYGVDFDNITKEQYDKIHIVTDSIDKLSEPVGYKLQQEEIKVLQQSAMTPMKLDFLESAARFVKYMKAEELRPQVTELYNKLTGEQKKSPEGENIHVLLFPPVIVKDGEPMADTDLNDLEGNKYRLADFKGKYILIDFWSSGCGPCIMAMPEMKELADMYKDNLVIVSLSLDDRKMWERSSKQHEITWNNLSDEKGNAGIAARYGVYGIPHYALITPDGILQSSWSGYGKGSLKHKIKEVIGE
jgi:thiol-disulfide isomerase/thioredoxin